MELARPHAALLRRGEGAAAPLTALDRFDISGRRFGIVKNGSALRTIPGAERN
jgi:hypothetical protein